MAQVGACGGRGDRVDDGMELPNQRCRIAQPAPGSPNVPSFVGAALRSLPVDPHHCCYSVTVPHALHITCARYYSECAVVPKAAFFFELDKWCEPPVRATMRACAAGYAPLLDVGAVRASSSSTAVTGSFVASGGTDPILFAPSEIRFPLSMDRLGAASSLPPPRADVEGWSSTGTFDASSTRVFTSWRLSSRTSAGFLELPNLRGFPRLDHDKERLESHAPTTPAGTTGGSVEGPSSLLSAGGGRIGRHARGTPLRAPTLESWYASTQSR
jgi:hypothetical protein